MDVGLSKLGSALLAVFAVCLLILAADLLFVLWRRRRFQRRSSASGVGDAVLAGDSPGSLYVLPSKELLYFFCWKSQSARIEPNEATVVNININGPDQPDHHHREENHDRAAAEIDDFMKIHPQGMYGPSRLLFTIKEEEEADHDHHERSHSFDGSERLDDGRDESDDHDQTAKTVTISTTVVSASGTDFDDDVAVAVLDDATPFSTPCGSPPYYTPSPSPSPSPSREELKQSTASVHESYAASAGREKLPFVSLEIIGV